MILMEQDGKKEFNEELLSNLEGDDQSVEASGGADLPLN